jgi:probable phosphomutase (TIGR03848 family)
VATVLLVRHGLTAMTGPVLAGHTPGVHLDERGTTQAAALAERLRPVPLAEVVTSPLDRCLETAAAVAGGRDGIQPRVDDRLAEVRYGDWTGRPLKELAKEPLWRTVQAHPSGVVFPDGEAMAAVQHRAVAAVRRHDAETAEEHGDDAIWVAVSHGDVIKAILADALGTHLDLFQRLHVDPASLSIIRYTETRPSVLGVNTHEGRLDWLKPPPTKRRGRRRSGDAEVGGGAGPPGTTS